MNLIKSCCLFVVFSSFLACTSQVSDVKSVSYTEFVNPFIGTDFTGNTYPGAQAPFGMVQLSPDNGLPGWDRISGYFYPDSTIAGFSHTHLSGTGAGDLYDISFMPVTLCLIRRRKLRSAFTLCSLIRKSRQALDIIRCV